ncbi:MAG TPA: peptidase domain-containing ABC transporter [Puia sp.]|nr:peptidase domain-containing ABC transporter [Puia sp.]
MLAKIFVTLVLVSVIQLIYPFLAKNIFDIGIGYHSTNVVVLFLCCQVVLIFSKISLDFIRGRVLLYISTHVTLSLLSDFWIKLNRLPMIYFNTSRAGEMLQRINENEQVQSFLTGQTLNTLFSLLNFIVFSLLLVTFKASLFLIFTAGMLAYFAWMARFYKVRRELNSEIFDATSRENEATLQLIRGMEEIRLNSVHQQKRWEWEDIQRDLFRKKLKLLSITQYQQAGAIFFSQTKDVVLTFIVVRGVMKGELSFGAMLAVQYILGQLSGPAEQFVNFVQDAQRAKMAVDRLNEIHGLREEDEDVDAARSRTSFPTGMGICIRNMSFSYPNSASMPVLKNISFDIEPGKMTAIVGSSGSGKTTLLRILLKTYDRYEGSLSMGDVDFKDLRASDWRERCGAVLQDGFIFNDSIARNIAVGDDEIDEPRLIESCKVANIYSFVRSLPDNFNTRLGASGLNVSQGQRQRLLLARAAYRKPDFVFFDEPTNAMDVHNEREVVRNIRVHFRQKTIVVIAHRLSTVRNADKIIVLDDGCMIEEGTHEELTSMRGKYYDLINNQLDIIEH